MKTTANYGLKKPEGTDVVDIQNFNDNADIIDAELKKRVTTSDYTRQTAYAVDTGSANTYVVTLDPAPTALTEGICIAIKIKTASTGASTLNVNGLGAKTILDSLGNAITSGGLKAGIIYTMRYNGTNFIVQGKGGGGDATAPDLLSGKKATVDTGPIAGSMPNNGAVTITPSGSAQTIPLGYHNGQGKVSAVTVPVANVLSGTTIAGQAGTMPNKGAVTITPGTADKAIPAGYHNGSGKVVGGANLKAGNIKKGVSIFDIVGTLDIESLGGKQWASGTTAIVEGNPALEVTGLDFTPKVILLTHKSGMDDDVLLDIFYYNASGLTYRGNRYTNARIHQILLGGSEDIYISADLPMFKVTSAGFYLDTEGNNNSVIYEWIAYS